jgi:hypothetical protein
VLDQRQVKDVTSSHTLALLYRVATFPQDEMNEICERVHMVLDSVPLGKENRERELGPKQGNPALGGYDCVVWTVDALAALDKAGLIDLGGKTAGKLMNLFFFRSFGAPRPLLLHSHSSNPRSSHTQSKTPQLVLQPEGLT